MKRRHVVQPCDNLGSVAGLKRDRTWVVWDRDTDTCESDHDTRDAARGEAARMNALDLALTDNVSTAKV